VVASSEGLVDHARVGEADRKWLASTSRSGALVSPNAWRTFAPMDKVPSGRPWGGAGGRATTEGRPGRTLREDDLRGSVSDIESGLEGREFVG